HWVPAFAGTTSQIVVPAKAGMQRRSTTLGSRFRGNDKPSRRPCESQGSSDGQRHWVPALAGTTSQIVVPAKAGIQRRSTTAGCRFRGNDSPYARNARSAAASVASTTASECAAETKPASKADGARYTPASSMAWKKRLKR